MKELKNKIYIDTPVDYGHKSGSKFSHMMCKDIKKLHGFAQSLGIKRCWYDNRKNLNRPHYDVKEQFFNAAIENGAIYLTKREWLIKNKELFGNMFKKKKQNNLF